MDGEFEGLFEIAQAVKRFKMYPYFDIANYILMCMSVREDNIPIHHVSGTLFITVNLLNLALLHYWFTWCPKLWLAVKHLINGHDGGQSINTY